MSKEQRPGTVYWIDHYVVPVSDIARWSDFYTNALGAKPQVREARPDRPAGGGGGGGLLFTYVGECHVGGAKAEGLTPGTGSPRYSWFIRPEEVELHLRRLDAHQIAHSGAIRTSDEGEPGTAIRFADPDGNQLALWAPARLPDGAMANETTAKVGRIAGALLEARDLGKTADFYSTYCGVDPLPSGDVERDTVVFPLAAGGRLAFKKVDSLGNRTAGHAVYRALHQALVIRDEDFLPALEHMYRDLPEWDHDPSAIGTVSVDESASLPARTGIHGNPIGPEWKKAFGRGDSFYDWDENTFHFVNANPKQGSSMATYESVSQRTYVDQRLAARG
ncbi:MAG: VOC family protein [Chloroflexi bacterium]|nr:VOC family protein [Chloroflexota bacterium]